MFATESQRLDSCPGRRKYNSTIFFNSYKVTHPLRMEASFSGLEVRTLGRKAKLLFFTREFETGIRQVFLHFTLTVLPRYLTTLAIPY